MKTYTVSDVLGDLRRRCEDSYQSQVAEELGVSPAFLNDVLHLRRDLSPNLARALGYQKQPGSYVKVTR